MIPHGLARKVYNALVRHTLAPGDIWCSSHLCKTRLRSHSRGLALSTQYLAEWSNANRVSFCTGRPTLQGQPWSSETQLMRLGYFVPTNGLFRLQVDCIGKVQSAPICSCQKAMSNASCKVCKSSYNESSESVKQNQISASDVALNGTARTRIEAGQCLLFQGY